MEFEMTKFKLAGNNCFPIPTELILNFSAVLTLKIVLDYPVYDSVTYCPRRVLAQRPKPEEAPKGPPRVYIQGI